MDQLRAMGFDGPEAEQALRQADGDIEVAVNMLVNGAVAPATESPASAGVDDSAAVEMLVAMGFPADQAQRALNASAGDANAAAELLMQPVIEEFHAVRPFAYSEQYEDDDGEEEDLGEIVVNDEMHNPLAAMRPGEDGRTAAQASETGATIAAEAEHERKVRLTSMGFSEADVARALTRANGDEAVAAEFLISTT